MSADAAAAQVLFLVSTAAAADPVTRTTHWHMIHRSNDLRNAVRSSTRQTSTSQTISECKRKERCEEITMPPRTGGRSKASTSCDRCVSTTKRRRRPSARTAACIAMELRSKPRINCLICQSKQQSGCSMGASEGNETMSSGSQNTYASVQMYQVVEIQRRTFATRAPVSSIRLFHYFVSSIGNVWKLS